MESTALTVAQRASVALGAAEHEKKLIALAKQSTEIVAITNAAGYQQLHAARMVLKNERVALEKLGKAARDDATKFSNAIIAEQKRLIGIIEPEEERLLAIQEEHDTRIEREKAAKIEAERLRVERIQAAIADIKAVDNGLTIMSGSVLIDAHIEETKAITIDAVTFAEFQPAAEQAKVLAVIRLNQLHAGGAQHHYEVTGFNTASNASDPFTSRYGKPGTHSTILFQNGPIPEAGVNGVTQEVLIAICIDRLECFQAGPFACIENAGALEHLKNAQECLHMRTKARMLRNVESTHTV